VIDLRMESKKFRRDPVRAAHHRDQRTPRQARQTILFLNRRGFSTSLICAHAATSRMSESARSRSPYHRAANRIVCHICGHQAVAAGQVPGPVRRRGSVFRHRHGKVEDAVAKLFPTAVVKRMDADAMQRRDAYRETLGAFATGKIGYPRRHANDCEGLHFRM